MSSSVSSRLSRRAARLAESATMRVNRRATELRSAGREIVDLSAGEPDFPTPSVVVEAARQALADGHTGYTAAAGLPALREALARRYAEAWNAPWTRGDVVVTVGAKAALFLAMQILIDEGEDGAPDELVLPTPAWVSFEEQVRFAGGEPVAVPTSPDDRFALHAAPLLDAITERTRVVLVNSPCNPTGGTLAAAELRRLVEGCAERGVILLADETYERYVWEGEPVSVASLAREFPETVVLISSFSKTWAMTGWRLGWIFAPPVVLEKVIAAQSHATSNPTTFAMYGALAALAPGEGGAEADVVRMLEEFARRRKFVIEALDRIPGVSCRPPDGAFYAFPDVSAHYGRRIGGREIRGSLDLCEVLLDAGVALVPGVAFGDDRFLRLSFACSRDALEKGLERLASALGS